MTKSSIKNFVLIASGIAIATSTAIFATSQQGTSIQANLVNLVQYLGELNITSDGTANGDQFLNINGEAGTMFASSGNFAFDFNSHTIIPFDAAAMLYQDANVSFANGIINSGDPMITLVGSDVGGEQIGISVRDTNNEIQAMIEYESTGNQDEAVQVQHQLKVKADGTTISFDDYNVLGSQTQLGLGGYGFYITASSGGYMGMDRVGQFTQSWNNMSLVNGYSLLGAYNFVGSKMQTGDIIYINGIMDLIPAYGSDSQSVISVVNTSNNDDAFVVARPDSASIGMFDDYTDFDTITQIKVGINNIGFNFPGVSYSFPAATGTAGQFLQTDGAGQLVWADAGASSSSIQHDKISISSAELLALNTNPVQLIPAPGAGKVVEVLDVTTRYNFNTTAYDTYPNADIIYSGAGYEVYDSSINLGLMGTTIHHGYIADADIAENDSIVLINILGNPENGDGTLDIYITYRVIDL